MRRGWTRLFLALGSVAAAGCGSEEARAGDPAGERQSEQQSEQQSERQTETPFFAHDSLEPHIARVLKSRRPDALTASQWRRVERLYDANEGAALWHGERGMTARAGALLAAVAQSHEHGLNPADYLVDELDELIGSSESTDFERAARADAMLTSAYVRYAEHMLTGRIRPQSVESTWHIDPYDVDLDSAITRGLRSANFDSALRRLAPREDDYEALRREMLRYRGIANNGGWKSVPSGSTLAPSDTSDRVPALRQRLAAEGYQVGQRPHDPRVLDAPLAAALAEFQQRNGLEVDTLVGPATRRALNESAERRALRLAANLERLRWLPHDLGSRHVIVNLPAFSLRAYEAGEPALTMRVIVGEDYQGRATPVFADSMSYLEFYPFWNIPMSIARRAILPEAMEDRGHLSLNNYEVVTSWSADARVIDPASLSRSQLSPSNFQHRLRQRPGHTNALGLVKFMSPNEFAIYLHDTPVGERLAQWTLSRNSGEWNLGRVQQAMQGPTKRVDLEEKIPVYLVYLTTFARNGQVVFRPDIYDRDGALMRAIGSAIPDAEAVRRAEALARLAE